jgi:C1A family cysteine protease
MAATYSFGWVPDYPDFRDYTYTRDKVKPEMTRLGQVDSIAGMLKKLGLDNVKKETADLRRWCSPVEEQGRLGSCTANAGVGMIEYFEKRAFGKYLDGSRLFLYKTTRNLLNWTGDRGALIRKTMQAMVLFGVPPEEYWPYNIANFDKEPQAFTYSFAGNYKTVSYYRLDSCDTGKSREDLLNVIKAHLALGLPSMFGFTAYGSIAQAINNGKIPFPTEEERIEGGHAVMAVGFDDKLVIHNSSTRGPETKGALLIRNSWGTAWGEAGYGWLPYEYVRKGLAIDWWTMLKNEWVDTERFGDQ